MKKASLIGFTVLFMIVGQANGDWSAWWWPPTSNTKVVPQNPTSSDVVTITLSGKWPDSCIPIASTVLVTGNDIYFDVIAHPPSGCFTVITPWARTRSVGPLSPGMYTVYARLTGDPDVPETYTWIMEFIVMASVYYVDADALGANTGSSWEDAYNYLQDALAAASSGDEIRVAEGVYKPDEDTAHPGGTSDRNATFHLINGVAIYGGYAGFGEPDPNERDVELYETILSGDLNGDDVDINDPCDLLNEPTRAENSYHVVKGSGTDASAVIDGFTITAGYNDFEAPIPPSGGGMLNREGSPTVRNCTFSSNMALAWGYGMGGGMHNYNSSATIINCTFTGNASRLGGGMYNRNWRSNNKTVVVNCTFIGNYAKGKGGGVRNYTSSPIITNCIFSGNSAGDGGGMFNNFNCTPMVSNCTFTGNIAAKDSGGICNENNPYYGDSTPIVTNCILWNNSDSGGTDESAQIYGGIPTVNYNCIQGWTGALGGTGNIDVDPCFVSPGYWADANDPNIIVEPNDPNAIWIEGDYHLYPFSLCINAGDPNYFVAPDGTDLDGNPRISAGRIDMGAYESNHIETRLWFLPRTINRHSRQRRILTWLRLPEGIAKDDIDSNTPLLLYPGEIEPLRQYIFQRGRRPKRVSIIAYFDRSDLMDVIGSNGRAELKLVGRLKTGQYFFGSDTVRIITRRPPPRRPLRRR